MDRSNKKLRNIIQMHNSKYQCHMEAAKQESYKKAYLLTKNIEEFFWKKFRRKDQQAENDNIERVTGLGRRTREEIAKWNQMTALRFQTGGRHQASQASLRGRQRESIVKPGKERAWQRDKCCKTQQSDSVVKPSNETVARPGKETVWQRDKCCKTQQSVCVVKPSNESVARPGKETVL